jgi:hypothetical protein
MHVDIQMLLKYGSQINDFKLKNMVADRKLSSVFLKMCN